MMIVIQISKWTSKVFSINRYGSGVAKKNGFRALTFNNPSVMIQTGNTLSQVEPLGNLIAIRGFISRARDTD